LALPLSGIQDTLKAIAPYLRPGCVVTDTASLKQPVLQWAEDLLPAGINFVGGDPVVSPAGSGPEAGDANLFDGTMYCVVAGVKARPDAVALVSNWVSLVGARPYYLEAAEHDGLMAGAAHLPLALALALTADTMHAPSWREMRKLAGGSFETITALIGDDPAALANLLLANQSHLLNWLDSYAEALGTLRQLVADGAADALSQFGEQAITARRQWLHDRHDHFVDTSMTPPIDRPNLLRQMLVGGGLGRRPKEARRKP
jgi:prephenate dehydrogenase